MVRCEDCVHFDAANPMQYCSHPLVELNPFGFDIPEEIDCDGFENAAYSHESVVDMVVHEDIELFMFGGR